MHLQQSTGDQERRFKGTPDCHGRTGGTWMEGWITSCSVPLQRGNYSDVNVALHPGKAIGSSSLMFDKTGSADTA